VFYLLIVSNPDPWENVNWFA